MDKVFAEFEMDRQHGPIIRVTINGVSVGVYLDQETGVVTYKSGSQAGIEVRGNWWEYRQYKSIPLLPDEVVDIKRLLAEQAKSSRYMKALYNIIDAWDGNDDSMSSDPAEIARAALAAEVGE